MGVGGMERLMAELARQMTCRSASVETWLAPTPYADATLDWMRAQQMSARIDAAVMSSQQAHGRRAIAGFRGLVRRSGADIDVVNLHCGTAHISLKETLAVRLAGKPCVATVHAVTPWSECGSGARDATRRAARLCRAVIVHANATRANLLDAGIPGSKIHLVPCGIPVPLRPIAQREARQRLGLPPDAFVIVTVARLIAEKGVDDLIHAVSQMRGDTRNVVLLVAGDGPERSALESLAVCLPGVNARFVGHCENLDAVYACGDVFALPSHAESFGLVFVEAALHGLPSVATNVGGIPEAVLDRETGLLVPLRDRAALADALYRMRDDAGLRRRLGIAAQARAQSQFSEDSMAEGYLKAIMGHPLWAVGA